MKQMPNVRVKPKVGGAMHDGTPTQPGTMEKADHDTMDPKYVDAVVLLTSFLLRDGDAGANGASSILGKRKGDEIPEKHARHPKKGSQSKRRKVRGARD